MNVTKRKRSTGYFSLGALLATLTIVGPAAATSPDDVVVVVHADNPTHWLSVADIRSIYLGHDTFWGDKRITPLSRKPDHAASALFFKDAIGQTVSRYKVYWRKRALAGKGIQPREVADARALLAAVRADVGAVGYLLRSELDGDGGAGVKVAATLPVK